MNEQNIGENVCFMMFYAGVTVLNLIACCYLLLRRANAIAPDVTPPLRLRRWTAAFFAASALSHLWNLPVYFLTQSDDVMLSYLVGSLLDCMTVGPLAIVILLALLQDRRRPLWPVCVAVAPFIVIMALCVIGRSDSLLPVLYVYFLLFSVSLIIYMVRAVRQYGRWLRDNYADLEQKVVWQSFVVLAFILFGLGIYTFTVEGLALEYAIQLIDVVLVCYLLWRVETLESLTPAPSEELRVKSEELRVKNNSNNQELQNCNSDSSLFTLHSSLSSQGSSLFTLHSSLQKYCIDTQLYLQHDLTIHQLAIAVGTNRCYLSQYFSRRGTTYNAYINDLRIDHFVSLYREAVAIKRPVTAQQLAQDSGYRNYTTFSNAFKQRMGKNVTAWMQENI